MTAAAVCIPAELFAELGDAIARVVGCLDDLVEHGGAYTSDREARNELEATWALARLSGVEFGAAALERMGAA